MECNFGDRLDWSIKSKLIDVGLASFVFNVDKDFEDAMVQKRSGLYTPWSYLIHNPNITQYYTSLEVEFPIYH